MTDPEKMHEADAFEPTPAPAAAKGRSWWRWLVYILLALLLVVVLLSGGIAWWASSPGSLQRTLALAQKYLPQDMHLEADNVQGSLTRGGHIERLEWRVPGTAVTLENLRFDWFLAQLLERRLQVDELQAERIHVRLSPQPEKADEPSEPFVMPQNLSLPIQVNLPLRVGTLEIESVAEDGSSNSSSMQQISDIEALYRYDGTRHSLQLPSLHYQQSQLQADIQAHARSLDVDASAMAYLHGLAPEQAVSMLLPVSVKGSLASGQDAVLNIRARALQLPADFAVPGAAGEMLQAEFAVRLPDDDAALRLNAEARVHPWRAQPVRQAEIRLHRFNARDFHAAAPETALQGRIRIQPEGIEAETGAETAAKTEAAASRTTDSGASSADVNDANDTNWRLSLDIQNPLYGAWDAQRLPVRELALAAELTPDRWRAQDLRVRIGEGRLQIQGEYLPQSQALKLEGALHQLPLTQIHSQLAAKKAPALSGTLQAAGKLQERVDFAVDMASAAATVNATSVTDNRWNVRALKGKGYWSPAELLVESAQVDAFQAKVDARRIRVMLPALSSVEAVLMADAPGLSANANIAMKEQSGDSALALKVASAERLVRWLKQLPVLGEHLAAMQAEGAAEVQAKWTGGWKQWAEEGRRSRSAPDLHLDASLQANALKLKLPASAEGKTAAKPSAADKTPPLRVAVDHLQASLRGNFDAAALLVKGDLATNDVRARLDADAAVRQVADGDAHAWNVEVKRLLAETALPKQNAPWKLAVGAGLSVLMQPSAQQTRITTNAGRAVLTPPDSIAPASQALTLEWQPLSWLQTAEGAMQLKTRGRVSGIRPAWVDALAGAGAAPLKEAGISTDLVLNGEWDVDMGNALNIQASLQRERGDLWLGQQPLKTAQGTQIENDAAQDSSRVAAGIRRLALTAHSQGNAVQARLDWDTERAGVIDGTLRTQMSRTGDGWTLADDAPLAGQVKARFPDLGVWGFVAPPGWRVSGALNADVALSGSVQAPQLQGSIDADGLNLRSVLDGVDLHQGSLRSTINGSRLTIGELSLQGGTGSRAYVPGRSGNRTQAPSERGRMLASGYVDWSAAANGTAGADGSEGGGGSGIAMDVKARFENMQVLARSDRQVTLAGDLAAALQDGALRVRGDLNVVRASITLPESGAPTLGSDVRVVRKNDPAPEEEPPVGHLQTAQPMDVEIRLGLGRDFALQGYGITTRLAGDLTIRSPRNPRRGDPPFGVVGEIRTDEGRYRAWGQALNVETGAVMFNGPYSNPSLNMLAIRPNIDVRAGVRVTGTAQAPRVSLYSEPDLPDAEKLSWVVLGRNPASGGAEGNAMQQAALAMLSGSVGSSLAGGLGLDEVGLGAEGMSVGKRLSDKLYVTYAASMSGAAGTLYVFYDISRRLTARGQTGAQSAIDLIYTMTYD